MKPDGMRISLNKLEAVYQACSEEQKSLFLGFTEYHSRYDQLTTEDFQISSGIGKTQERWSSHAAKRHAELTEPDMRAMRRHRRNDRKSKEYF